MEKNNNISDFCISLLKRDPYAINEEGIQKLVSKNKLSFEDAARCMDIIESGKIAMESLSTEADSYENNSIDSDKIPKLDDRIKNSLNPKEVIVDTIIKMTKNNDSILYQDYVNAMKALKEVTKDMVKRNSSNFTHTLSDIETILNDNEKDAEVFKKIKETSLKLV